MDRQMPLVIATRNKGKIVEIKELLKNFPVLIQCLDDFGPIPEVVEDGTTFEQNAYKKAGFVSRVLGAPALADDSGLMVDALAGRPGVLSARYGGEQLTDKQRYEKLLVEMKGKQNRKAAFQCVISIAVPTGQALTYESRCDGLIAEIPDGDGGFGYDPIFYYPPFQRTFARLSREEKNSVSHRGKALGEIASEFDKVLIWIRRHLPGLPKQGCMGGQTKS
ncbi:MAG: XTP/dITP diphosphatase [Deltaproteobacteria bacterium]|nr:XTP/dITP diphosphatase [Deltaproteobacteria bacterium]